MSPLPVNKKRAFRSLPPLPCLAFYPQDVDVTVSRKADEQWYDLDVGQRVFLQVPPAKMMGFDYPDIDATSLGI